MTDDSLANSLNRHCHCISVDHDVLQKSLETRLGEAGAWSRLQDSHPHLLAESPVFISHDHVAQMKELIEAIEHVVSLESYQEEVLGWAPPIARDNPGAHGVFFGYDFHLTNDGPQLIEINTNAGGALLLLEVASAQQACCNEVESFVTGRVDTADLELTFIEMFRDEFGTQHPGRELQCVAVVDENPREQYLSPEFTLFKRMFEHHGIDAIITGPEGFTIDDGQLFVDEQPVDLVYNRLTDFYLQSPACEALNRAYRDAAVVVTPSPYTHAMYANKQNLTVLCDADRLRELGVDAATITTLVQGVPRTELVTAENARMYRGQTTNFRTDGGGLAAVFTAPGG